mmetsp:Transcript_16636/g.28354  ORF Transcript_16636/g.28354 Transcript_16636/m.28354 type:complete len:118 (+) Transcript_16636:28-381(+)
MKSSHRINQSQSHSRKIPIYTNSNNFAINSLNQLNLSKGGYGEEPGLSSTIPFQQRGITITNQCSEHPYSQTQIPANRQKVKSLTLIDRSRYPPQKTGALKPVMLQNLKQTVSLKEL